MTKAKEIAGLNCGAGEARGMRLVLLARLGEMCEHREAALAFDKATEQPQQNDGGEVEESFGDLGRRIISSSWEELRGRGAGIYRPLKTKRLHKIRIAAKRLRYSLELFAACFGGGAKEL